MPMLMLGCVNIAKLIYGQRTLHYALSTVLYIRSMVVYFNFSGEFIFFTLRIHCCVREDDLEVSTYRKALWCSTTHTTCVWWVCFCLSSPLTNHLKLYLLLFFAYNFLFLYLAFEPVSLQTVHKSVYIPLYSFANILLTFSLLSKR